MSQIKPKSQKLFTILFMKLRRIVQSTSKKMYNYAKSRDNPQGVAYGLSLTELAFPPTWRDSLRHGC